jgi:homoserine dehydrogenase
MGANQLERITGIVNGTCNYILTRMSELDLSYDKALEEATELGYAEANPDADVSGRDSAEKLSILVKEGFDLNVDPQVLTDPDFVKGIISISSRDIQCAKELDYTIKLLATSEIQPDSTLLFGVRPHFVSNRHPLATVNNNLNAIYIKGDRVGELMLSGKGAGGNETASAVVADTIATVKSISSGVAAISAPPPAESSEFVTLSSEMESKFYLRILTSDIPIAFGGIMWLLGGVGIVPEYVQQHITSDGLLEIVMITQPVSSQKLKDALRNISALPHCKEIANSLPLLEAS